MPYNKRKQPQLPPEGFCGCFLLFFNLFLFGPFLDGVGNSIDQPLLLLQRTVQLFYILQNILCMNFGDAPLQLCLTLVGLRKMYNNLDVELPPILFLYLMNSSLSDMSKARSKSIDALVRFSAAAQRAAAQLLL